ncbi:MAG: hypothetical protein ACOX8R_06805 [Bacillota bacterium]|jgi:hypothetical protein
MIIDVEALREELKRQCLAAFFGGGFGGALVSSFEIENASPEALIDIALRQGIDLREYETAE